MKIASKIIYAHIHRYTYILVQPEKKLYTYLTSNVRHCLYVSVAEIQFMETVARCYGNKLK